MQPERIDIGLVEDDPVMGGSILQRLEIEGYSVRWWQTGKAALAALESQINRPGLMVCDIRLPDISGEDIFNDLSAKGDAPPFLFVTGYGEIDQAVRLMRSGAVDFMTKPFRMEDFLERVRASRRFQPEADDSDGALGISPAIRRLEQTLVRYAPREAPVLLVGETGSGKEVAARFLHGRSPRSQGPFIAVNCAAIPADLLESEIFGHEKGAFTGADKRHRGYAERAAGGTLFLDEIGDMPGPLQSKILRLIESGSFTPIGGEDEISFEARIVAATHRDIFAREAVSAFRQDLYYRLAVLPAEVPPLRQRPEDIPWLAELLLDEVIDRNGDVIRGLSAAAEEAALAYDWPGNVRELRNRLERAVAMANGDRILPGDLFPEHATAEPAERISSLADVRDAAERRQIERALQASGKRIAEAARLLGVSRTTLWEKMNRLGLQAASGPET